MALADPALSRELYEAIQASPWNEHKIVLQDFLRTAKGRAISRAAAANSGISSKQLMSRFQALPEMDMYLPFDEHRESWKGTPNLLVALLLDGEVPTVTAFSQAGLPTSLDAGDGVPRDPLLILHPAEFKQRRNPNPSSSLTGSAVVVVPGPGEREECTPETCSGGGGGGGGDELTPNLINKWFVVHDDWEHPWLGDMEIRFEYLRCTGAQIKSVKHSNVNEGAQTNFNATITFANLSENPFGEPTPAVQVRLEEDDSASDDEFVGTGFVGQDTSVTLGGVESAFIKHSIPFGTKFPAIC
ncbi:MAG: hypothetical protein ACREMK_04655 [Gemmatimonadota bacterium]